MCMGEDGFLDSFMEDHINGGYGHILDQQAAMEQDESEYDPRMDDEYDEDEYPEDEYEYEHDGQPDEAQEWHDFDPDC